MQKYEYKFVEVPSTPENKENPEGFSPFKIIAQVVSAESHNGWRLKQIIEPKLTVMGAHNFLVVLEKGSRQRTVCKITGSDERPIFES